MLQVCSNHRLGMGSVRYNLSQEELGRGQVVFLKTFTSYLYHFKTFSRARMGEALQTLFSQPRPVWLLLFPEVNRFSRCIDGRAMWLQGTRISPAKQAASAEYCRTAGLPVLRHHLLPRYLGVGSLFQSPSLPSGQKASLLWRSTWTGAEYELSLTSLWLRNSIFFDISIGAQFNPLPPTFNTLISSFKQGRGGRFCPNLHSCLPPCRRKHLWSSPCPQVALFVICEGEILSPVKEKVKVKVLIAFMVNFCNSISPPQMWRQGVKNV